VGAGLQGFLPLAALPCQPHRFVDMHATWIGSTGSGGLDLSPVYVPAYVFSWWHGGAKVCLQCVLPWTPVCVLHAT
jgi:hypothetical protein